jgi:hypothetical protein
MGRKRRRELREVDAQPAWGSMFDELEQSSAHGAITRIAASHNVPRRTLSRRWAIFCEAVRAGDESTQWAMRGNSDRRADNHLAVPRDVEERAVRALMDSNSAPSRADVSRTLREAHAALPGMAHRTRSLPALHSVYCASSSVVRRVLRHRGITDKKIKLRRERVQVPTADQVEQEQDDYMRYLGEVEEACANHGRALVVNVDETAIRTIVAPRRALAYSGGGARSRPSLRTTRSDRECTTLICAVAADGTALMPCVLARKQTEAAVRRDRRWVTIQSSGWTDAAVYRDYIERVILPYTRGRPATLVHDSYRAHHHASVLRLLREHDITSVMVPPGHTDTAQPLDVGVFGPVKARAARWWREHKRLHPAAPDHQLDSVSWHVRAFRELSRATIRKAWAQAVPLLAD